MRNKIINKIVDTNRFKLFSKILKNKNYDSLYTMFGKNVYMLFTPFSHKAKDLKKLMEEKNYPLIYNKYGKFETLFIKDYSLLNKKFIDKLIDEDRFYELYELYGADEFYDKYDEIEKKDVIYETGSKSKYKLYKTKKLLARGLNNVLLGVSCIVLTGAYILGEVYLAGKNLYKQSLIENKEIIELYDEKVTDYADYINGLGLDNDLDVVMKVLYDMWNTMEGYGKPELDVLGIGRLDFLEQDGVGVCRNIADDFTAKLNAINPNYNARNIIVEFDNDSYTIDSFSNIEVKKVENEETNDKKEELTEDEINVISFVNMLESTKILGDHMVTMFEPIGKDYTLVVDATNPSIGIVVNGKIYMFSTPKGDGLKFKPLGHLYCEWNYTLDEVAPTFFESFIDRTGEKELDELNKEWGLDAQNDSLEKVKNLDNNRTK